MRGGRKNVFVVIRFSRQTRYTWWNAVRGGSYACTSDNKKNAPLYGIQHKPLRCIPRRGSEGDMFTVDRCLYPVQHICFLTVCGIQHKTLQTSPETSLMTQYFCVT